MPRVLPYIIKTSPKQEEEKQFVSPLEKRKPKKKNVKEQLFFIKI